MQIYSLFVAVLLSPTCVNEYKLIPPLNLPIIINYFSYFFSAVHTVLKDLLPSSTYFRFNPRLTEQINLDNCNPEQLQKIADETRRYLEKNEALVNEAAASLKMQKSIQQKLLDKYKYRRNAWPNR